MKPQVTAISVNDDIHVKEKLVEVFSVKKLAFLFGFALFLNRNSLFSHPSLKPFLILNE